MRFSTIILTTTLTVFSINTHADVLKWVDDKGKTHYSNKEKKSSRNKGKVIKFVEYETPKVTEQTATTSETELSFVKNNFTDVSNDIASYSKGRESINEFSTDSLEPDSLESNNLEIDRSETHRIILDQLDSPKSYIQRKSRNTRRNIKQRTDYTIAEYNQRCDDAREELIEPLRQDAIYSCMKMKHSMSSRTRDYCEEINEDFGDGGMNSRGYYIQRMFHNISECQEAYEAWDRRSRKMRGYSEE